MNPYRLKDVFNYLTSNNQLLKRKLKLGTDEIPIPPKRSDVTTIEAINRFNKANPRVDTTNLKPLSVKQSNVKQSNVDQADEGVIQGAFDTATREAQSEGFPAPNYEKFKSRYLKKNMKADGGRMGYKDGLGPSNQPMGPVYTTNKIEDAAKEVVKRLIKLDGVDIPLTEKIFMSLGPDLDQTEIRGVIDILGGELNIGGGMKGDDKGIGFSFRKEFQDGGMLVQPSDDGSRPGYADDKRGPKSENPYLKDKKFLKYAEENFGWTPDMGTRGIGGTNLASMMSQYEKGLAVKNKIIGVTGLVDALGEDNPFSKDSILRSFSYADKKITKNMSVDQKSRIKMAKKIRDIILDVSGQPTTLKDLYGPYKNIRTGGNTKVFELSKRQINKINKLLSKDYAVQGMQEGTTDNIYNLFKDKKFMNAVKKYEGGAVDIDSYLFKKVFEPGKGGKNSYAYMQLGRILRGEIELDGIKVDKKLGNKIIKSIAHDSATNIDGEMGKAASRWSKFQMAKFFDDPNATYKNLSETVTSAFRDVGIKNFDLDEIFPARTGQITYDKGSGVYNQFVQVIDSNINRKSKRSFDGRMSSRLQDLDQAYKIAQKTGDYSKVEAIVKANDTDIENFYKTNPEAKGKVNLTKFRFNPKTKTFLSPEQVFESQYKGSYETIPSKIRQGMEKYYSKTGISIDPGTALTLEKAAAELSGDTKTQAKVLRKMGFKCKFAGSNGGLGSCDDPASYIDDINKTQADINSDDPTVRNKAIVKNRKALEIAKTIPKIGKFVQKAAQVGASIITTPLKALGLTSPIGVAIEGAVEGGIYDYYRAQGYNHNQAYAETFTPKTVTDAAGITDTGVGALEGAQKLLDAEKFGAVQYDIEGNEIGIKTGNPKGLAKQYSDLYKNYEKEYNKYANIANSLDQIKSYGGPDLNNLEQQLKIQTANVNQAANAIKPGTPAYEAFQIAEENQAGRMDNRRREYLEKTRGTSEPSEFQNLKKEKERGKEMIEMFPMYTPEITDSMYKQANIKQPENFDYNYFNNMMRDQDKMDYFADNFRLEKASGGIASLTDTIPPESGPTPHGLRYPYNNVKKIKE